MELLVTTRPPLKSPPFARAEEAARRLLSDAGRKYAEVSGLLVDDAEIRTLNRDWRGIDKATDVLSWPQEEGSADPSPRQTDVLGDVAISLDTAARQAAAREWSL